MLWVWSFEFIEPVCQDSGLGVSDLFTIKSSGFQENGSLMKKKILVVDDEAGLLKMTLLRLDRSGYEVFGAADGQEALDLARQKVPDLIILDVFLPKVNGVEVAKILKRDSMLKYIPIIFISAAAENLEAMVQESGVEGFLPKPFETKALLGMIEKYLSARAS